MLTEIFSFFVPFPMPPNWERSGHRSKPDGPAVCWPALLNSPDSHVVKFKFYKSVAFDVSKELEKPMLVMYPKTEKYWSKFQVMLAFPLYCSPIPKSKFSSSCYWLERLSKFFFVLRIDVVSYFHTKLNSWNNMATTRAVARSETTPPNDVLILWEPLRFIIAP